MNTQKRGFYTEFFILAIPMMLQFLSQNVLNVCDTLMVGRVSSQAISAVTVSNKTFLIFNLFVFGIGSGVTMYMSQFYGAKKTGLCRDTFRFGIVLSIIVGALFTLAIMAYPAFFIDVFVDGKSLIEDGVIYISIVKWSYPFVALAQVFGVYFRVFDKQHIPMITGISMVILNIILNYTFIFGHFSVPALGLAGAAIATTIARVFEFVALFVVFITKFDGIKVLREVEEELGLKKKIDILRKTLPLMVNEGLWSIALSLIFANYCYVSEVYIPSITVVDNVFELVNTAYYGCSVASGMVAGKVLGTGDLKEAKKVARRLVAICTATSFIAVIVVLATARIIPGWFALKGDIYAMASTLLITKAFFCWMQGYGESVYYILRAGGDVKEVFIIDGLFMMYGPFLVSFILSRFTSMPIQTIYLFTEASYILKIVLATYFYKKGRWLVNLTAT